MKIKTLEFHLKQCLAAVLTIFVAVFLHSAHAAPIGHSVSAGNVSVTQNDPGNTAASVTTLLTLSVNDFRVRGTGLEDDTNAPQSSRGDYAVSAGPDAGDDLTNGVLMTSTAQNGSAHDGVTKYGASFFENVRTNASDSNVIIGAYFVCTHGSTNGGNNGGAGNVPEFNISFAAAWFPYSQFIGGFARNHGPQDELGQNPLGWTNGGALNQLFGSSGLVLGSHFIDQGSGRAHVILTNYAGQSIDSRTDGILLVNGAKNESANFALSQVNTTNGGWNLFVKDQGQNTLANYEQDPLAFVYIPKTNTTIISGRFLGDGSIAMYSGNSPQFTVTSNAAGVYELKVIGYAATNGVLVISPGGGEAVNADNLVHYELNGTSDGWIIQSRDCAPMNLEAIPAAETVATFAFIPAPTPGVSVVPTNNLQTTEGGGQDTFSVVLDTRPTEDVTIPVSSSDTTEGTVAPASLTFTTNNWNVPQIVTVTGVNDALTDGSIGYTIILGTTTSTDPAYSGLNPADVSVANADNDIPGIAVSPTSGLVTTESGGTNEFTIVLNAAPSANVTIGLSSSDTTEGTVSPSSVTFTTGDWSVPQTVVVTGVNDFVDDGNINYTIITAPATSTDGGYSGLNGADVSVSNLDDDVSGVSPNIGLNVLTVVEGKTNGYTVVLDSQPTANVTVNIASSNTSQGGTAAPTSLIFTPANWNNPQPVTATGADDLVVDGNTYWTNTLTFSSSDILYAALSPVLVTLQTLDNEGVLTLPSGDLIYGIGQAGIGIDGRATLLDANSPNYGSGNLTVTLTLNGTADDRVEVRNTGTGPGQIGVSGSTVSYGGTTIGSVSGGSGVTPLLVTLNSSATPAAAEALMRNVTFRNVSSTPSENRRAVSFTLTDGDGGVTSATTGIRLGLLRYSDFQEGADHGYGLYTGQADIHLRQADPDTPYPTGSGGGLFIDYPVTGEFNAFHLLMRFDNIMGNGFGQIPSNAVIVSADLLLRIPPEDSNSMGDGSPLYRMLQPFDATTATWNGWGGDGITFDDIEARSTAESEFGLSDASANSSIGTISFSVRPDVQAWQGAANNYGWAMPGWVGGTDGTTVSPGEATNVFDRPRLRVKWLEPGITTTSFRQGVNGYTNTADTRVRQLDPDVSATASTTVGVDWIATGSTENQDQVLIQFGNIVGIGTNQIPPNSRVHAAVLELASRSGSAQGHGGTFHAMLQPWADTATWNTMVNGIQTDDVEAAASISVAAGTSALTPFAQGGFNAFELTDDVRLWVSGARANYGWAILPWTNGADGWFFGTAQNGTAINRPELRVYFTPGVFVVINSINRGPTSATLQLTGPASTGFTVLRSGTVNGTYTSVGSGTTLGDGTASFTDNSPLPGAAFYRISIP